jgi:hypothetical protein
MSLDDIDLDKLDLSGLSGMDFDSRGLSNINFPGGYSDTSEELQPWQNFEGMDLSGLKNLDLSGLSGMDFDSRGLEGMDLGSGDTGLSRSLSNINFPEGYSDTSEELQPWQNFEGSGTTQLSDAYKYEDGKWSIRGNYDEITGRFVPDPNGTFVANEENEFDPLKYSGTNLESMDGYTYDKKTGTWTTPRGEVYTPKSPPSHTAKSGAQVMVNAGALPSGYAGLTPDRGSTAGGSGGGGGGSSKTNTPQSNLGSLLPLLLMMLAMNRGGSGGGSGQNAVIPGLTATQRQTPYAQQQRAPGYRPGQGGISYFEPTQYTPKMAAGGGISGLLHGPGDGVSDSIPAVIDGGMAGGGQPAKVARGEYIFDARSVAALGNGSTDAGAERLDKMREDILRDDRKAGVGKDSKAYRHLLA